MFASKNQMIQALETLMAPHIQSRDLILKWKARLANAPHIPKAIEGLLPSTKTLVSAEEAISVYSKAINHIKNK